METSRSAPSGGYDFGNKRDYRRRVYSILGCVANKSQAQLLILPSTEGAEIPLAIQKGYQPHNIHAVDRNAKLLESAPWRIEAQYKDNKYVTSLNVANHGAALFQILVKRLITRTVIAGASHK